MKTAQKQIEHTGIYVTPGHVPSQLHFSAAIFLPEWLKKRQKDRANNL
jgi:hypothetical protein